MNWQNGTSGRTPKFERVSSIFERVRQNVASRTGKPELPFGIDTLDQATLGLPRKKLSIVAARTSEGKTSLAIQSAVNLADAGKTVAYISLEDDRETLVEKVYCQMAGVDNFRLRRGEVELLNDHAVTNIFEKLRLLVLDDFGYTAKEIKFVVEGLEPKPDVVFIDYVQMIEQQQRESEYEAVSRFVRDMKVYVEQQAIGMVLVSQINRRGASDGRPSLHTLASCGRLEQVSDLVLLLFNPSYYGEKSYDYCETTFTGYKECPDDYFEIEIAKNKTGPRNKVIPLKFLGSKYLFEPWKYESYQASDKEVYV